MNQFKSIIIRSNKDNPRFVDVLDAETKKPITGIVNITIDINPENGPTARLDVLHPDINIECKVDEVRFLYGPEEMD